MTTNTDRIRQVSLLNGEKILAVLSPKEGLIPRVPEKGGILTLTSRRILTFTESEGRKETRTIPLEDVRDVCVRTSKPNAKPLFQGASLLLGALIVAFVLSSMTDQPNEVAILLGLAIALLGLLFIGRYFAWEQGGELIMSLGEREVSFPLVTERAIEQSYEVLNGISSSKAGEATVETQEIPEIHVGLFSGTVEATYDQQAAMDGPEPYGTTSSTDSTQSIETDLRPEPERPLDHGSSESSRTLQP